MTTHQETSIGRDPGTRAGSFARARELFTQGAALSPTWRPAARSALVATVLCFAAGHVAIRAVDGAIRADRDLFNLFTLIEAHRLWPALASDANAQWWSLALGMVVYVTLFTSAVLARRPAPERSVRPDRNELVVRRAGPFLHLTAGDGMLVLVAGLGIHMACLAWIGTLVRSFPPVPDVLHACLPYVDFGPPGELVYVAFLVAMATVLFRTQPRTLPSILAALGIFYAIRGIFLFLLPIGLPPTAPPVSDRFVLWPYAEHAFFPGGHTGMMTVLSLSVISTPWRRAFLSVTLAFALGTLLARTHYTADAFGGWLVGYAVILWVRRRFGPLAGGIAARRDVVLTLTGRSKGEV
jgi:hypothetical protein